MTFSHPLSFSADNSETIRRQVAWAYHVLKHSHDLSPKNKLLSATLSQLIYLTSVAAANDLPEQDKLVACFTSEFLTEFRGLLAKSESAMEHFWAAKFNAKPHADYDMLHEFIYWENYQALAGHEYALLVRHGITAVMQAAYVGAGPLPLSLFILQLYMAGTFTGIDHCWHAVRDASRLASAIGMPHCAFVQVDGASFDYKDCEIVFIASLVDNKDAVIDKIKQDRVGQETYLLIRSAEYISVLYYEPYDATRSDLVFLGKTDYVPDCINTSLLFHLA